MKWVEFANEYVVSLFPAGQLPEGLFRGTKKYARYPCIFAIKIENGHATWFCQPDNWKNTHLSLVERLKKNPKLLYETFQEVNKLGEEQIRLTKNAARVARRATNLELVKLYNEFVKHNIKLYMPGMLLPLLDYESTVFLSDELNRILKKRRKEKYFSILTIPQKETAAKKQDLDLLKILSLKNKARALKSHTRKYRWVYYVYEGPALEEKYFVELVRDLQKRKINPKAELTKYHLNKRITTERQNKIIKSLNLNAYERQFVNLVQESVFQKANRRELQSHSYCDFEPVLQEIANRLNLSLKQVRMMMPSDVKSALMQNKINYDELNSRVKLVFLERTKQGTKVFSGRKAGVYLKKNSVQKKVNVKTDVFKGTTSFPGKVKGVVRIVNSPDQIQKMQKGDILVALTTNPNLMPAIRIASAIVTDEGGLTCHAAIVSRELRIPCVVGTGYASRILKDGDKIAVDANKGIVRKI